MVDPENITDYNLTDDELEERLMFWICAAGKNGRTAAKCLDKLLKRIAYKDWGPFRSLRYYVGLFKRSLAPLLKECGIGCYNQKAKTFLQLAMTKFDLRTCSAEDLERVYGIGMKTSRCFIIHSRPHARYAGLDTHLLKYLRAAGIENVPKATPGSKKEYLRLEKEFLRLADEANKTPANFDLEIWNNYSVKST